MGIVNLMEERVLRLIDEICKEYVEQKKSDYLINQESRLDVACFVLNRIAPKYVSSARGYAHVETDVRDNPQIDIDIVTLVNEGLKRVSETRRTYYETPAQTINSDGKSAFTVVGRFIDTGNFVAAASVEVYLYGESDTLLTMQDKRWSNPYPISDKTPGTFIFRPLLPDRQKSTLRILVKDERFENYERSFVVDPEAGQSEINLSDLYLIPKDKYDNDMQLNPSDEDNP